MAGGLRAFILSWSTSTCWVPGAAFDGHQVAIVGDVAEPGAVGAPGDALRRLGRLLLAVDLVDVTGLVSAARAERRQQNASTRANRISLNEGLQQGLEPEVYRTSMAEGEQSRVLRHRRGSAPGLKAMQEYRRSTVS